MKVFTTIAELCKQLDSDRNAGKKIGLVPTMGATQRTSSTGKDQRGHSSYNGNLLKIFFSEVGIIGIDYIEEFTDDLSHSVEMSRSVFTFHNFRYFPQVKYPGIFGRIDFFYRRSESIITIYRLE